MGSNDLAMFAGSVMTSDGLDKALAKGLAAAPAAPPAQPFMRLDQTTGSWVYGQENVAVEEGSEWAINTMSLQHGYVCWSDPKTTKRKAELLGERFVRFDVDLPSIIDMPDHSDSGGVWKDAVMFDLACVSGEDQGQQVTYNASTAGGTRAYAELLAAIADRPSPDYVYPVVKLESTSYESKYGRTVFNPIFRIVGWANADGQILEPTQQRAATAVGTASEEAEDVPVQDPPPRRRRGRG